MMVIMKCWCQRVSVHLSILRLPLCFWTLSIIHHSRGIVPIFAGEVTNSGNKDVTRFRPFQNKTGIPHLSIRFGIWFCAVSGNMADTAESRYCKRRRRLRISYGFLKFAVRKNCSWQPVLKKLDKEAGKALQYSVICKSLWQQKRGTEELTFFIEYCSWINCNAALDY